MKKLLKPQEMADECGIPAEVLLRLSRQGKLSVTKLGHRTLMFLPELVELELENLRIKAVA